jgi:hypothetical protein
VKAAPTEQLRFPFVYKALESIVNNETVHVAMQKRAAYHEMTQEQLELVAAGL